MPIPRHFEAQLSIPAVAAPMFRTSGPDLVVEACKHGVIGAFPSLNQRTPEGFDAWLVEIEERLRSFEAESGTLAAPYAVNLNVRRNNPRHDADLAVSVRRRVPLIITSLGAVSDLVRKVHEYGGLVFHDVTTVRHAEKAAAAGVDGLVLVCAGAGGHAGTLSPLALVPEVKQFFGGTLILAGCISTGDQILAAEALGADMAYLGTRFLATREAMCPEMIKQMVVDGRAADIIYTAAVGRISANYLVQSLIAAGFDAAHLPVSTALDQAEADGGKDKVRKLLWSAGQGCGSVKEILSTATLCERLVREYHQAAAALFSRSWWARKRGEETTR